MQTFYISRHTDGIDISLANIASQRTDLIKSGASNFAAISSITSDISALNTSVILAKPVSDRSTRN